MTRIIISYKLLLLWLTMTAAASTTSAFGLNDSFDGGRLVGRLNRVRGGGIGGGSSSLAAATIAPPPSRFFDNPERGGGSGEISNNVAKEESSGKKKSFLARHAFACACVITTINAVTADLLTQLVFEAGPWNPKRSLVFAAFGFIYQGMAQYFIVNKGWEYLFPGNSKRNVFAKVCGMNLLSDPLLFMPCFYIFKETLASGNFGLATIKAALLAYKGNCLMDWRNSWSVWFPGHAVTYGVMPSHKRIPWMAFLSFFYMCILSITRG